VAATVAVEMDVRAFRSSTDGLQVHLACLEVLEEPRDRGSVLRPEPASLVTQSAANACAISGRLRLEAGPRPDRLAAIDDG
jgi:hypothetical protein